MIYLENNPIIFDVIKVKVSSIVRPLSPVHLHIGGEVEFKMVNPDYQGLLDDKKLGWKSTEPTILRFDDNSGKAFGLQEGRADVHLSNQNSAASIVHVGRVNKFAQIEQNKQLVLDTDKNEAESLRVRVKLFLVENGEEVMPTTQYDGVTLIR